MIQKKLKINGETSTWKNVTNGVPKGSVLDPVLFLLFINDIPEAIQCALKLFADDTKLYTEIADSEDANRLQDGIFNACEWANKWQMIFNTKKCKTLHIGPSEPNEYYMKDKDNQI